MKIQDLVSVVVFGTCAAAHGGILSYTIDGKDYISNPYKLGDMVTNGVGDDSIQDFTEPSIQRPYYWYPVEDVTSSNMTCNFHGNTGNAPDFHAPVAAGGNVDAFWDSPEGGIFPYYGLTWRHAWGPMLAYLARCPGDSCAGFDPKGAVWFKIAEAGLTPEAVNMCKSGSWEQGYINRWSGSTKHGWNVQIPKGLRKGAYLIRHEIIMLAANPPQFYPNCAQLMVTGDGDKLPKDEELVEFPGAYKATDPGIVLADWAMSWEPAKPEYDTTDYKFPGPKVWSGQ